MSLFKIETFIFGSRSGMSVCNILLFTPFGNSFISSMMRASTSASFTVTSGADGPGRGSSIFSCLITTGSAIFIFVIFTTKISPRFEDLNTSNNRYNFHTDSLAINFQARTHFMKRYVRNSLDSSASKLVKTKKKTLQNERIIKQLMNELLKYFSNDSSFHIFYD